MMLTKKIYINISKNREKEEYFIFFSHLLFRYFPITYWLYLFVFNIM